MMHKILVEANTSPGIALTWALNGKNSLQNNAGFSPFQQKVFDSNPKLPVTLSEELPSLPINQ